MSPVHLSLLGDAPVRVPVVDDPFWIGRDPGCDLCLWDLRVSRKHARIERGAGGFVLVAEGRHGVFVNGRRVDLSPVRDGDEIGLTPPQDATPVSLRFLNTLPGAGAPPPGTSISAAWLEAEKVREGPPRIVADYEVLGPLTGDGPTAPRLARERTSRRDVVLSVFPPVPVGAPADAWLRFLTAVAGAEHPALARVVDGGLDAVTEGAMRWLATPVVRGRPAWLRVREGPQAPITVVRRLRALAAGLHLLHSRGVVHGAVTPSHVLLRKDGSAVLVGYGRAFLRRDGVFEGQTPVRDPLYVAPEVRAEPTRLPGPAGDVFGLAATGWALLAGRDPFPVADGGGLPPVGAAGPAVPASVEDALRRALDPDPVQRPTAEDFGHALAFAEASLASAEGAS
ncbi:MAG: FHA domain-containing protein [Planctomycetes bacterium]|nr:FHA domain-containing protein [Planctomycetota bacterium]